jgi:ribbon-helix-helix CopG family protein
MIRTMISMDASNLSALKKLALERGISLAELIRTLLQEHLRSRSTTKSFKKEDFLAIVGLGESGERDVSERHDRHIGKG